MATIVVVEDERNLNDIMCMYLRDAGHTVFGCLDANEAYAAMHGRIVDLVVSDIMMPERTDSSSRRDCASWTSICPSSS